MLLLQRLLLQRLLLLLLLLHMMAMLGKPHLAVSHVGATLSAVYQFGSQRPSGSD